MGGGWRGRERFGGIGRGLDRQLVFVMMTEEELRWLWNLSRTACSRCLLYIPHTKHYFKALTLFPPTKHGCCRAFTSLPLQNDLWLATAELAGIGETRQGEKG